MSRGRALWRGEGTTDRHLFAKKISEANEKKTFLESQLSQIRAIEATQTIDESVIIKVLEQKKNLLFKAGRSRIY